jgi:hypothetical protein
MSPLTHWFVWPDGEPPLGRLLVKDIYLPL